MRARGLGRAAAIACATLGVAACGNQVVVTAGDAASNYVYAVAEGNVGKACGYFEPAARQSLVTASHPRASCAAVLTRCVPKHFRSERGDPSQLLFASTAIVSHGNRATVGLSATPAADAVHSVTLIRAHGHWLLTSPGRVVTRCLKAEQRHHRHGHRRG